MRFLIVFLFLLSLVSRGSAADESAITISAVGDIMLGTSYPSESMLPPNNGKALLAAAIPYLSASDIRFGNFEGTLFDGPPQPDGKSPGPNKYMFKSPVDYVERLIEANFNVLSLANNHVKDFGKAGLKSTKDLIMLAGIQYSSKDGEVAKFNVRGTTIALIATDFYSGQRSIRQSATTLAEIESLKKQFDIVIVSSHVGAEGSGAERVQNQDEIFLGENRGNSVAFARKAIDAGADVIIMHGPHVPRGMEVYRNRIVMYSLGNFATATGISINGLAGVAPLVRVQIQKDGAFIQGQIYSFVQDKKKGTILDTELKATRWIKHLSKLDFPNSMPVIEDNGLFKP